MTLEEKASQLRYDSPAIPRLGIPAYNWWNEALHGVARAGVATSFPQAIGMAAAFDEELLRTIGDAVATEGRAKYNEYAKHNDRDIYKGLTFWSPNVNIFRDPRWGRGHETYGEDPYLTSRMGVAYVEGLQGTGSAGNETTENAEGTYLKTAACAKHFAVHSGPEGLRHEFNAVVGKKDLYETYLPAFEACVKEGEVEAVMGAYNRTNGEPCCGSNTLVRGILRGEWGFQGHFVSDCWAIQDFHQHHCVTKTPEESAAMALKAGCDVNCGVTYLHLLKAHEQGLVTGEEITQAAERLFTTRYLLGCFTENQYDKIPYEVVECREHLELAQEIAREGMVLLKNDGTLPLRKDRLKTIGVIGPNADSRSPLVGNYHGTSSRYITMLEGIQDAVGEDVRVLYSEGCHLFKDRVENLAWRQDRISEALTVAEHSDVVVLCLGLDETLEGEEGDAGNGYASGDKADLQLPEVQRELLEAVAGCGKPVVLCVLTGSAVDLNFADGHVNAILQVWYPGARGGKAAADILFGACSPSGKLPVTFYRDLDGFPAFEDYSMKGRTYRYLEKEPLYPFGYGLTYGRVEVREAECLAVLEKEPAQSAPKKAGQGVPETDMPDKAGDHAVKAVLENTGAYDTDEVLQVYIHAEDSAFAPLHPSLCAFARVSLKAGEKKEVSLTIPAAAFTIVDEEGRRYVDGKHFSLYVGTSQPDERSAALTGMRPVKIGVVL
ncbi:MAG TPA: glycoside hydrolase family 3 C-terminal domain-containing protein [Candidatus Eisenbergiella merdipullorum]|uniref:Glycoside hydrolase family 3 C-terminal domain-containing protein n=1 Tax=Candidatus Eisenbergiella merdipullorum TaxID=2838553 RepID=A0A9D2L079_9FIRM|nr:glycoside hydrolase family 3 C-terminal domain-containing protein [Candidatus Eisenbergiella merdipullorum]